MSDFKWKFSHLIEDTSVCFKNDLNGAKVIMGLTGKGNVMVQIFDENGNLAKENTIRFDAVAGNVIIE